LSRELVFLVAEPPADAGFEVGAPCRIKTSEDPEANPFVAFASEEVGRRYIVGRGLADSLFLAAFSALPPDQAAKCSAHTVLFFDEAALASYLEHPSAFDFAPNTLTFRDAEQRLQAAS